MVYYVHDRECAYLYNGYAFWIRILEIVRIIMTCKPKQKEETRWWIVVGSAQGHAIWHEIEYSKADAIKFAISPRRFDYDMKIIEVRKVKEIKIRRAK